MLEHSATIDRVFHALADGTRRTLIQQLSYGPAAVSDLARPLSISLAAVVQHLQILEDCGVVTTRKTGRVRTCQLDPEGLLQAEKWIASRRLLWEGRLQRLDALLGARTPPDSSSATTPAAGAKARRTRDPQPKSKK